MARKFLTDLNLNGTSRIIGLQIPLAGDEPATKDYVLGLVEGLSWKDDVRAAANTNISISTPPTGFDGVTLASGDRILLLGQTNPVENGIYTFTNTSTPLVRALDATTANELKQAIVPVHEGTVHGGRVFRQTQTTFVVGTDPLLFVSFGDAIPSASTTVAGKIEIATQIEVDDGTSQTLAVTPSTLANYTELNKSYTTTIGNGTTTTFPITHNLQTENVVVSVREATGNKAEVTAEIRYVDSNNITVIFETPPATGAVKIVVVK